jgi:hypothetical protein
MFTTCTADDGQVNSTQQPWTYVVDAGLTDIETEDPLCQCVSSVSWRLSSRIVSLSVVVFRFVSRSSRSEVSALAHRAVLATIECHVTLATCLHITTLRPAGM